MRLHLYLGRPRAALALAFAICALALALAPARSSAAVITIDDGAQPGTTDIPFTCSQSDESEIWLPTMGFVYRNVEPFALSAGDTIAFDIQMQPGDPDDLGFSPQVDIALAHAPSPGMPFVPASLPDSDFTVVARAAVAASRGNRIAQDYDLAFTVDAPFRFPGGNLIIRISNPMGELAVRDVLDCIRVITADITPSGSNRLVGTFARDADGEFPFDNQAIAVNAEVPYVRIIWTQCGDREVSGAEVCDDGNTDDTDDCTNACQAPACGDGVISRVEQCDNSARPDDPDIFCNASCEVAAFAKGSGCSAGGGAGMVAALVLLVCARRRKRRRVAGAAALAVALWAAPGHAQKSTEGFRVDRFEMAPSVEDGLVVQDPRVLRDMTWSLSATLGLTNTLLRVVPTLDSDDGVDVVGTRLSAYLDFAIGLGDRVELSASLPFAMAQSSQSGTAAGFMLREAGISAIGDARVGGSVLVYGRATGPQAGLATTIGLPIGSEDSFTGDGNFSAELLATAGYVAPEVRVLVNAGARFRPTADYVSSDQGSELIGRLGVAVPLVDRRLTTSLELDLIARAAGPDAFRALGSPVLMMAGARYHFPSGFRAGAGVGMGLTDAPGSPAVRALLTVGYSPEPDRPRPRPVADPTPPLDRDGDRILDKDDRCPTEPEDYNGFQDDDGCPDGPPAPDAPLTLEQVVTLPAPIEFVFDTAIMLPGGEVYLQQVLTILQNHPEVLKLEIQGHTSSEGGHEYNMGLSNARARTVYTWLVDRGIDASRLVPRGYGLTQPLAPNDTEPNRQRNRRVQFRLLEQAPGSPPIGSHPAPATPAPPAPAPATPAPPAEPRPQ